jgi:hypothetical protein
VSNPAPLAARVFSIACSEGSPVGCAEAAKALLKAAAATSKSEALPREDSSNPLPSDTLQNSQAVLEASAQHLAQGCRYDAGVESAKCCGLLGAMLLDPRCGGR